MIGRTASVGVFDICAVLWCQLTECPCYGFRVSRWLLVMFLGCPRGSATAKALPTCWRELSRSRSTVMRLAGIQICKRQTHSWLVEILVEAPRAGRGGHYGLRCKSTVSAWNTTSPRNPSGDGALHAGHEGSDKLNNSKSHPVIVAQFEELLQEWGAKTPQLLDALQVSITSWVLKFCCTWFS